MVLPHYFISVWFEAGVMDENNRYFYHSANKSNTSLVFNLAND